MCSSDLEPGKAFGEDDLLRAVERGAIVILAHFAWSDDRHDNRPFPVLWLVTDVSYCRQFPVLMRDRFCPLLFSLLLTGYKNGEGELFQSRELQTTHSRPIFCEHRESGRASLRNRRPQRYTCMGVHAILDFWGAYLRLLA